MPPPCAIIQCRARKGINNPQLSIHKLPENKSLRQKWLDVIGEENINPRQKEPCVCSLHFSESCFNRTLNIVRLRENAVPSSDLLPPRKENPFLRKKRNIQGKSSSSRPNSINKEEDYKIKEEIEFDPLFIEEQQLNASESLVTDIVRLDHSYLPTTGQNSSLSAHRVHQCLHLTRSQKICKRQRAVIKRMREKIRRQTKKLN